MLLLLRKNTVLLVVGFILFLFFDLLIAFFLFSNQKISVSSNNTNFSLRYHQTKKFSQLIDEWKIFSSGIQINNQLHPVKKIHVALVDTPEQLKTSKKSAPTVDSSIDYSDGLLTIRVYVSQLTHSVAPEQLSFTILQQVLTRLYTLSHVNITPQNLNNDLLPTTNNFRKTPLMNPFQVVEKK